MHATQHKPDNKPDNDGTHYLGHPGINDRPALNALLEAARALCGMDHTKAGFLTAIALYEIRHALPAA